MGVGLLSNNDVWSDRHKAVALYFDQMALAVPPEWSTSRINEPRSAVRKLTDAGLLSVFKYSTDDHKKAAAPIISAIEQWPKELNDAIGFVNYFPKNGKRGTIEELWFDMDLAEIISEANLGGCA